MPPQNPEFLFQNGNSKASTLVAIDYANVVDFSDDETEVIIHEYDETGITMFEHEKLELQWINDRRCEDSNLFWRNLRDYEMSLLKDSSSPKDEFKTKQRFPLGENSRRVQRKKDGFREKLQKSPKEKRSIPARVNQRHGDRRSKAMSRMVI